MSDAPETMPAAAVADPAPTTSEAPEAGGQAEAPDFNRLFDAIEKNTESVKSLVGQNQPQIENPFQTPAPAPGQFTQPAVLPQQAQQPPTQPSVEYGPDYGYDALGPDLDLFAGDPASGYTDTSMLDIAQHPAFQQMQQQVAQSQAQVAQMAQMFDQFATRDAAAEVAAMFPELEDPQVVEQAVREAYDFATQNGFPEQIAKNPKFVGLVRALGQVTEQQANREPAPAPAGDEFEVPGGRAPSSNPEDDAKAMHERMMNANGGAGLL